MRDGISLRGGYRAYALRDGRRILIAQGHNLVTDVGLSAIAQVMSGEIQRQAVYIAIGTGTTAPTATDTALEAEKDRAVAFYSKATGNSVTCGAYFQAPPWDIREIGIFLDGGTGTGADKMIARMSVVIDNAVAQEDLVIEWTLTFNR